MKRSQFTDPVHGVVTVLEHEHGMMMTNARPNPQGRWRKHGDSYVYELTPNRAARRKK